MNRIQLVAAAFAFASATALSGEASASNVSWNLNIGGPGFGIAVGVPGHIAAYGGPVVAPYYSPNYRSAAAYRRYHRPYARGPVVVPVVAYPPLVAPLPYRIMTPRPVFVAPVPVIAAPRVFVPAPAPYPYRY